MRAVAVLVVAVACTHAPIANRASPAKLVSRQMRLDATVYARCVIRETGHVACWGTELEAHELPGIDDAVAIASHCILHRGGTVSCGTPEKQPVPGLRDVVQISGSEEGAMDDTVCARKADGSVWCWSPYTHDDRDDAPPQTPTLVHGIRAIDIAVGQAATAFGCARDGHDQLACWRITHAAMTATPAPRAFPRVGTVWAGTGAEYGAELCVREASTSWIRCWVVDGDDEATTSSVGLAFGELRDLAIPNVTELVLRPFIDFAIVEGKVLVWDAPGHPDHPTEIEGLDDAVGVGDSCALRRNGTVACWDIEDESHLAPVTLE